MQNNTAETAPKRERTAIYTLARIIFGFLFHTIFPLRFHNAQIVEEMQPPYIIMANHRSFADPMALAIKVKKYEIRFIGKRELAHGRLKSWLFSGLHMILVSRHATDMAAMRQCMQTLKDGHILGIFPEGTRHQPEMMQEVESGAPACPCCRCISTARSAPSISRISIMASPWSWTICTPRASITTPPTSCASASMMCSTPCAMRFTQANNAQCAKSARPDCANCRI